MSSATEQPHDEIVVPRKKWPWLLPCGCVTILALFLGLPVIAWFIYSSQSAHRVEELLAKARSAGQPTTPADLDTMYRIPNGKVDTTAAWTEVLAILKSRQFELVAKDLPVVGTSKIEIPPPGQSWSQLQQAEELLKQFQDALDKMHVAGRIDNGTARFDVKFSDGLNAKLPHAQEIRGAARLLRLEAHVRAHQGDVAGVDEALNSIFSAADALDNEPLLVSQLVRIALVGMAISGLEDSLATCQFTDEQLDRFSRRLTAYEESQSLTNGLLGERVIGIDAIVNPQRGNIPGNLANFPLKNQNLVPYLEFLDEAIEASQRPFPEALDKATKMSADVRDVVRQGGIQKVRNIAIGTLAPAFDAFFAATAREMSVRRQMRTLIAIEKFRRREQRFPKDLDELVPDFLPAVLLDPRDGKPLRYVVAEDKCKVYSIGKNRKDDGGKSEEQLDDVQELKSRATKE